jgi:GNAT superfamily N-acetyltransferase
VDIREIVPPETGTAFLAMKGLRTYLADKQAFVRRIDEVQRPEGYRIVGAFDQEEADAAAVAGFRVGNNLADGHYLYVDDLATRPEFRRRGLGTALLVWLAREAGTIGCDHLSLDSAVGPDRADAHRLYLNSGLTITAHHFERKL